MLRFILLMSTIILYFIVTTPILLLFMLLRLNKKIKPTLDRIIRHMVQWIFSVLLFESGIKITVRGQENIPTDQAVLYVGNHNSFFDIIISYTLFPGPCGYIAKKELGKFPFLHGWMLLIGCIFLDRSNLKAGLQMIIDAADNIKSGVSMFVFPEGTRNKTGDELNIAPFKEGAMKIADKAACPIVPVAFTGTANTFEAHLPKVTPDKVIVEFGKPIYTNELSREDKKQLGAITREQLLSLLKSHKEMPQQ